MPKIYKSPPNWTRDELILALDLYFAINFFETNSHFNAQSKEVQELSEMLDTLPIHRKEDKGTNFRNAAGVYMKLSNFLAFDPRYDGVGLTRGGKLDKVIWDEFANDQGRLKQTALAIRNGRMITPEIKHSPQLTHSDIKWIKNVTHPNYLVGEYAYLDLVETEFILHFPDKFYDRILDASTDDLIIVSQRLGPEPPYMTHLVQPIDNEIKDFVVAPNFRYGRLVRTIGYTGSESAIPIHDAPEIDLNNNRGYTILLEKRVPNGELDRFQQGVWELFAPFRNHGLTDNSPLRYLVDNDELERDFQSREGKLLFKQHRARERDSRLTAEKKRRALQLDELVCSVCRFSFETVYGESYIECHHTIPISQGERVTRLDDLALVCSNCHRMLHRQIGEEYLSIEQLRNSLLARTKLSERVG